MSLAELKNQVHRKVDEAAPEMLEWVLEVLGNSASGKAVFADADPADPGRKAEALEKLQRDEIKMLLQRREDSLNGKGGAHSLEDIIARINTKRTSGKSNV